MKTLFFIVLVLFLQPLTSFANKWELIDTITTNVNAPRNTTMSWSDGYHGVILYDYGINNTGLKITSDGGESWKILNIDSIGKSLGLSNINEFYLVDYNKENLVLALDNSQFLFSNDNAKTWNLKKFPYSSNMVGLVYNLKGTTGLIYEFNNQALLLYLYTTNKDLTEFTKINIPVEYKWYYLNNFVVYNDNLISCIGAEPGDWNQLIWIDNGVLTKYELPHNTCNVSFIDSKTGFSTAYLEQELSVYKTTNSGKDWAKIYSDYPATNKRCFAMLNDKVGILAGHKYVFLKTTDGGYTWNKEQISNYSIDDQGTYEDFYISRITLMEDKSYLLTDESLYRNDNITSVNENLCNNKRNNYLYPNPIEKGGNLSIGFNSMNFTILQICSVQGTILYSFDLNNSQIQNNILNMNLPSDLPAGMYILKLNSRTQFQSFPLIIQ